MLKKTLKIAFGISTLLLLFSATIHAQGPNCAEMEPICTDDGISFTAGVGETSDPGNDYGCLASQPNPSWYYLEISEDGDLEMELYADSDIDFIIWGPFDDLADAVDNCGTLGGVDSPIVDCSYSSTAYETPEIPGCVIGEVYILLITNYASIVQEITLGKIGGEAETNCGIVDPPCTAFAGTYHGTVNGSPIDLSDPIFLCLGDSFEILSNDDYILPSDTIDAPVGDGIYTAQIIWLVYNDVPSTSDPATDPAYMSLIIPSENLADIHDADSPIGALGCGTYYLVPVTADDGNGDGGDNDNGSVTWDKDGNNCFDLGDPIQITYACEIEAEIVVNCGGDIFNGIDFVLSGGGGDFTVVSSGDGDLVSTTVPHDGTATVANLKNGDNYEITVTDEGGCTSTFSGVFAAPVLNPIVIDPAATCPDASLGNVDVTIVDGSGNGPIYGLSLNGTVTVGPTANIDGIAGTAVIIIAVDSEGCITDSVVTITSAGHFIDVDIITTIDVTCFGLNDGTASITANPVDSSGDDDGEVVTIVWTDPTGTNFSGDETNTSRTGMMPGTWLVTITDDTGCEVTIAITIESPTALDVFVATSNIPTCYGYSDASIDLGVTGGTPDYFFSWKDRSETTDVINLLSAGTYWGYVTDGNGCIDSVQIDITQPDSLYADFTLKYVLCYGDSTGGIYVDEVYNAAGGVTYNWNLFGIPNPDTDTPWALDLPEGTYEITILDENGCSYLRDFTITQNDSITFSEFGFHPSFCRLYGYQNGGGVVFAAAIGGVAAYTYEWTEMSTSATTANSTWGGKNPGEYKLVVVDDVGCVKTTYLTLDSLSPEAIFTVTSDQLNDDLNGTEVVCANFTNQSINFSNPHDPGTDTTFRWNLGFGNENSDWIITNSLEEELDTCYLGEAVYTVCLVVENQFGCKDTSCQEIKVYAQPDFIPFNIFSPDGDGINDVLSFDFGAHGVEEFKCVIVDRWGKEVINFTEITDSWDGNRKNGSNCSEGVYFYNYYIKYTNATVQEGQGSVTIVR